MEEEFVNNIIDLYKNNEWKTILNDYYNINGVNKLLWVFPSEDNIKFIQIILQKLKVNSLISVGCGSGLLEWILHKSLGLNVIGIEVDGVWWKCKYAPPSFIPLHLAQTHLQEDKETIRILKHNEAAILFCYFNNGPAFEEYMKHFTGDILIIIGPGDGKHVHTDPTPFDTKIMNKWNLIASQEVRNTKDFIAFYKKIVNNS